ncbi:MAG: glycosyltransferase family 2 protein [Actinomycetota bacterium]
MRDKPPSISIIIPTLNSDRTLDACLDSIKDQDYPKDLVEILVADAGSSDKTLEILKKHGVDKILPNLLITGEAGKAVGVEAASNEVIALLDSDNILDGRDWLTRMVAPFNDSVIVGSEPLYYSYRKEDTLINRYCALLGMNDPLCLYLGNYDRFSQLTGKWTGMKIDVIQKDSYLQVELNSRNIPTIGANGFLVRRDLLVETAYRPYLFDIDVVHQLVESGKTRFAKVDIGIIHVFADRTRDFVGKQRRRINDYLYFKKQDMRSYPWQKTNKKGLVKFILATVLTFPLIFSALRGYMRIRDRAWFFHIVACWLTLLIYAWGTMRGFLGIVSSHRRPV